MTCRIELAKMMIAGDEGDQLSIYYQEREREKGKKNDDDIECPPALLFYESDQEDVKLQRLSDEVCI